MEWGGGGCVEWGEEGGGSGFYCGSGSQPSKQNREAWFICGDYPNYHQAHRYIYHHINHHTSFFIYHHICHQTFHHTATSPFLPPFPDTFHPPAPLHCRAYSLPYTPFTPSYQPAAPQTPLCGPTPGPQWMVCHSCGCHSWATFTPMWRS